MKQLIEMAALMTVLGFARGAAAQTDAPPVPPPPADPPAQVAPDAGVPDEAGTQPAPAGGGVPAPVPEKSAGDEEKAEEVRARCAKLKKEGAQLPDECKAADLEVVFQGAVRRQTGPVKAVPQAKDTESDSLVEKSITFEEEASLPADKKIDLWAIARQEPAWLPGTKSRYFTAGAQVGYSWLKGRGSAVEQAYDPIINFAAEVGYQLFPMFQLALVADFDFLKGGSAYDKEVIPEVTYDNGDPRSPRDVGALLDTYFGMGLRPTFRINVEMWGFQLTAGVGLGYHYFHTSGRWRTKLPAGDRANGSALYEEQARYNGEDVALYSFSMSDSGLYGVFETALLYRLLEGRLGVGILFKYTVPVHGTVEPDVSVELKPRVSFAPPLALDQIQKAGEGFIADRANALLDQHVARFYPNIMYPRVW